MLLTKAKLIASLNLLIIHWSLSKKSIGTILFADWNKSVFSKLESNLVQSSRSKSNTCPRKGRLLRFQPNSTATSDDGTHKLGNYLRHDSVLIAATLCHVVGKLVANDRDQH